jgi:glycosyltransferase involved in cell wall biosynthesis
VKTTIVVPCFNEAGRLDAASFRTAIDDRPHWSFVFVDDGSTDTTGQLLDGVHAVAPDRVRVLTLGRNGGKGEAVRQGIIAAIEDGAEIVAFIDADLATPFEELDRLVKRVVCDESVNAVLGARVRRLGADVRRKPARHFVGRVYGTVAALALGVGIYDTQCGAKVFRTTSQLKASLAQPFGERWAFDVELLSRLTRNPGSTEWSTIVEEPLQVWREHGGSKLGVSEALVAGVELLRIGYRHRRARSSPGGAA